METKRVLFFCTAGIRKKKKKRKEKLRTEGGKREKKRCDGSEKRQKRRKTKKEVAAATAIGHRKVLFAESMRRASHKRCKRVTASLK